MSKKTVEQKLEHVYNKYEKRMKSHGMAFLIEDETGKFSWNMETGELRNNTKFAIASVTKMYAATVILNFVDEGKINLEDKVAKYLDTDTMKGLHIYKGKDYSNELTIKNLLMQTSGLPDYFSGALPGERSLEKTLDYDREFTFEQAISINKRLKPRFAPNTKGKAYYSDMNWDLIGLMIEKISGKSVEENYKKYIYEPLGLKETYLFTKGMEFDFPGIWVNKKICKIPKLLAGWPASGGIIATKTDLMVFLKAFWNGVLFNKSHYDMIRIYNRIQFFPMEYGLGNMRFNAYGMPEIIGHSGATGVLCYYVPKYQVYITGCMNELSEGKATRLVLRLANCFKGVEIPPSY